jgi:uncharacterized phage protein (TIGR02218 family)
MRDFTPAITAHIAGEVTTLAMCWKITRQDATVMGFTDFNNDLTVDSILFKAATGFTATTIQSKADFSVDNLDIEGMLSSIDIQETDILNGKYDYAEVEIFMVNYEDTASGKIYLKRGRLGEVRIMRSQFVVELRGLSQHLTNHIGRICTPSCDAVLGDARCAVSMGAFTFTASVTSVTDRQKFKCGSLTQDTGYFTGGEITFTSGANNGLKMEVKDFSSSEIILALPMPNTVLVGNTISIKAGCDKTDTTCKTKFNNLINFRGFPKVPGTNKILETAGSAADLRKEQG